MKRRIELLRLQVTSGPRGLGGVVHVVFNGARWPLSRISGGTGSGESYDGEVYVGAFVDSCALEGPTASPWDIRELRVRYEEGEKPPIERDLGPRILAVGQNLELLASREEGPRPPQR